MQCSNASCSSKYRAQHTTATGDRLCNQCFITHLCERIITLESLVADLRQEMWPHGYALSPTLPGRATLERIRTTKTYSRP